jgi:hypothetical protein
MSPFCIHGAVPLESPAYVSREFERRILQNIYATRWVLLLGPRQHGKTTGLLRISQELMNNGYLCAFIDLQGLPSSQTYNEFLERFSRKVADRLGTDINERPKSTDDTQIYYWLEKAIPSGKEPVVIIIDEASAIHNDEWRNYFYGQVRSIKNEQALLTPSDLVRRLCFLFAGCFLPDTLVNTLNSPFNTCEEISTEDLELGQAIELYAKVEGKVDLDLIQQIFDLVGGNPYLLQLVFNKLSVTHNMAYGSLQEILDFLFSGQDNHFQYLFKIISEDMQLRELVSELAHKSKIPNDPADANYKFLRTLGVAKLEDKNLVFRNKLYKTLVENSALFNETKRTETEIKPATMTQTVIYGVKEMTSTNISISNSNISGNIITSSTIQDSFNIIESSKSPKELKTILFELGRAVDEMIKQLPEGEIEGVEDDYKRLVDESTKSSPKEKWYRVSIEGLQKAAKNLGEIGKPVLELTGRLLVLLPQIPN